MKNILIIIVFLIFNASQCGKGIVGTKYIETYDLPFTKIAIENAIKKFQMLHKYSRLTGNYLETLKDKYKLIPDTLENGNISYYFKFNYKTKMYIIESLDNNYIFGLTIDNSTKKNYNALTILGVIITEKEAIFNRDLSREDEKKVIDVFEKTILPKISNYIKEIDK